MTDCVIVAPGPTAQIYGPLAGEFAAIEPSIWSRIIGAYLRKRGFSVHLVDMGAQGYAPEVLRMICNDHRPKIVAIVAYGQQPSASTQTMPAAVACARTLGGFHAVIIGGHPSALPLETAQTGEFTYVCDGEGARTLEGLLRSDPLDEIPGLVYRRARRTWSNDRAAPLNAAAGELEGDCWDLVDPSAYRAHSWQCLDDLSQRSPYASIYTSFNCPFACSFCCISAPFHDNRLKTRDPIEVVDEIEMLYRDYGVKTLKIADEMFILGKRHYQTICQELIRRDLGRHLNIWCYGRVDSVKPSELALLRAAGIKWIALGIESGSKFVRDGAEKELRSDDITGVVRAIQAADINVIGNFIVGLPDDTHETMQQTLDLALDLKCEFMNLYSAMAYPGSKLYTDAVAQGRPLPEHWSGYSQHSYDCTPLGNDVLSRTEVLAFRDAAFQRYFNDPGVLAAMKNRFGQAAIDHVAAMMAVKLPRKLLGDAAPE
jgi:radical SAM superfamily enzyme YgiQ (UPF0313 family)